MIRKQPTHRAEPKWRFGIGTQYWLLRRRRRTRRDPNNPWYWFRADGMIQEGGEETPFIPDMNGGAVSLNVPPGGTGPTMAGGVMPLGQKVLFFDTSAGVSRLDFSQNFTATSSTIMAVAWATNLGLGDQGLVVCANTALYAVLSGPFNNDWGCYVTTTNESGFGLDTNFTVVTLRVNADKSFDLFHMSSKIPFPVQTGSFPGRAGASLGGDPGGTQRFEGYVAEVWMYDYALPDATVLAKVGEMRAFYGI